MKFLMFFILISFGMETGFCSSDGKKLKGCLDLVNFKLESTNLIDNLKDADSFTTGKEIKDYIKIQHQNLEKLIDKLSDEELIKVSQEILDKWNLKPGVKVPGAHSGQNEAKIEVMIDKFKEQLNGNIQTSLMSQFIRDVANSSSSILSLPDSEFEMIKTFYKLIWFKNEDTFYNYIVYKQLAKRIEDSLKSQKK